MALRNGNPSGKGGKREGAGRKPAAIIALRKSIEERKDDAIYAFSLFVATMRDEAVDRKLRLDCAREVQDRVLGKPHQSLLVGELSQDDVARAIAPILAGFGIRLVPPTEERLEGGTDSARGEAK